MSEMSWHEANQRWLDAAVERLRSLLEAAPEPLPEPPPTTFGSVLNHDTPPALERLASLFGLSSFERDLLLLAAGCEMDPGFGALCAVAQGEPERPFPTFALALALLPGAHWDALAPGAVLRHWRLLEVLPGPGLTACALRVEERVLHYLRGLDVSDDRLAGMTTLLPQSETLVPSHRRQAERLAGIWSRAAGDAPVALLCGADPSGKRGVAAAACAALGLSVQTLPAGMLPTTPNELDGLVRLLGREAILGRRALLLDCDSLPAAEASGGGVDRFDAVARLAENLCGPLLIAVPERRRLGSRLLLPLDVDRPEAAEQAALWVSVLGQSEGGQSVGVRSADEPAVEVSTSSVTAPTSGDAVSGNAVLGNAVLGNALSGDAIATLTAQFDLGTDAIRAAGAEALERVAAAEPLEAALWSACRTHARPDIENLAKRLRPRVGWDDLVLPRAERRVLEEIAVHVRNRARVHDDWGFAERSSRGLGIAALFAGPSGTGKTMAAEVLARELDLDLYRVDLASVVSKYIGETEKNLKRIFDAADMGGAILLFDEADALFGKRSEVKDSHDRYANIEVGYLLQRIEAYRGLALLTTNLKDALDPSFMRRLRFVVRFPFPDEALRAEIWRRAFPRKTPTKGLDFQRLARLGLAGGHIKSIAIAAAFRAAEEGVPVGMSQVLAAARGEYAKLEKPFTEKGMEVAR